MEKVEEKKLYEVHNLEGEELPIIFHYNVVRTGGAEIANWHENIEFLYCNVGSGQINCNSVIYDVEEGDLVVVNSNLLHSVRKKAPFEYYCLIVDSDFLATNGISISGIEFDTFVRSKTVSELFKDVVREILSDGKYRVAGVRADILNLLVYLARNHSVSASSETKNRGATDESIKLAIGYIKSNFSHRLTLDEIAAEVNLSKYYFAREFKKATSMTVVAYINEIRCRNARKLLLSKKYSISEVAAMCGFENNSYFSKTFKAVMGSLPSELLRNPSET